MNIQSSQSSTLTNTKLRSIDPNQTLNKFLSKHVPTSERRIPTMYREITTCFAYMCPYAYGCSEKTQRPAQVLMRRCIRYQPEQFRITPGVSDLLLDMLAKQRNEGKSLDCKTLSLLDRLRPNGPIRKV